MRHVIWDWNGTLADDFPVVVGAVNESLTVMGMGPIDGDDYRNHYTRPVRVFYDRLCGRPVTDEEWLRINTVFETRYFASLDRVALTADARDAIAEVAAAGNSQSILSMAPHDELVPEVERHGLDAFMVRIDGNRKAAGATKERLLEIHLDRIPANDLAPVMIGDALDDALAARSLGVPCVLYDGGSHHRADLEAIGVPVAGSLVEAVAIALSAP